MIFLLHFAFNDILQCTTLQHVNWDSSLIRLVHWGWLYIAIERCMFLTVAAGTRFCLIQLARFSLAGVKSSDDRDFTGHVTIAKLSKIRTKKRKSGVKLKKIAEVCFLATLM